MDLPSDGEAAEVPGAHTIHHVIADAIAVLQYDPSAPKIFAGSQDLKGQEVFL